MKKTRKYRNGKSVFVVKLIYAHYTLNNTSNMKSRRKSNRQCHANLCYVHVFRVGGHPILKGPQAGQFRLMPLFGKFFFTMPKSQLPLYVVLELQQGFFFPLLQHIGTFEQRYLVLLCPVLVIIEAQVKTNCLNYNKITSTDCQLATLKRIIWLNILQKQILCNTFIA